MSGGSEVNENSQEDLRDAGRELKVALAGCMLGSVVSTPRSRPVTSYSRWAFAASRPSRASHGTPLAQGPWRLEAKPKPALARLITVQYCGPLSSASGLHTPIL